MLVTIETQENIVTPYDFPANIGISIIHAKKKHGPSLGRDRRLAVRGGAEKPSRNKDLSRHGDGKLLTGLAIFFRGVQSFAAGGPGKFAPFVF
jgi:hypothetical protein